MTSIRLDAIIQEVKAILDAIDLPNMSYDDDDLTWTAIKGLRHLEIRLRLKNARIKEISRDFLRGPD